MSPHTRLSHVAAAAVLAFPLSTLASPVTVNFSFTGAAVKGQGYFSYDSASAPMGGGKVSSTTLLTDFFATLNNVSWDESTVESGYLTFAADGSLMSYIVGDNCTAGACTVASNKPGFLIQSRTFPTLDTVHALWSAGAGTKQGDGTWKASADATVPEPGCVALVMAALAGLGVAATRRRPAPE